MKSVSFLCTVSTPDGVGESSHAHLKLDAGEIARLRSIMAFVTTLRVEQRDLLGYCPNLEVFKCSQFALLDLGAYDDPYSDLKVGPGEESGWRQVRDGFESEDGFVGRILRDDCPLMVVGADRIRVRCYEKHSDISVSMAYIDVKLLEAAEKALAEDVGSIAVASSHG